ncbi:MAG: dTDP-4-dehydrorhamnose 3,5-epimerase [Ignavibacteriales bacterium]
MEDVCSNTISINAAEIKGVIAKQLPKHLDSRGHLIETFRIDELPDGVRPVMSYVNFTQPGVIRGPHEHKEKLEIFAFPGPGNMRIFLWDNRADSETYRMRKIFCGGEDSPLLLIVPPGIVHLIENISRTKDAMLINYPTTLFKGWGRKEVFTDEIRYDMDDSIFLQDYMKMRRE